MARDIEPARFRARTADAGARLAEAGRLEREIGRAHARDTEEIILKLRMVLSGRTTAALSEAGLLAGAIEDLRRADP